MQNHSIDFRKFKLVWGILDFTNSALMPCKSRFFKKMANYVENSTTWALVPVAPDGNSIFCQ